MAVTAVIHSCFGSMWLQRTQRVVSEPIRAADDIVVIFSGQTGLADPANVVILNIHSAALR